ncbi:hypothetical protein BH10PSE18_BH10PSE18_19290 [soil metagenome]
MIDVTIVCAPAAREVFEQTLVLADGSTLRRAVDASDLADRFPDLNSTALTPGIWGRTVDWDHVLQHLDRVELCRPLAVYPKVARRERFQRQGARTTGLFARQRAGAKAGY